MELKSKFCPQTVEHNVLHTSQHTEVQWWNFPFYVNQYALENKLLNNSRKVKPDTIKTAFLFGLELEMQVELLKLDKNDEIDTLEQCIVAAWEIHEEPHVSRQVVQKFYGYGWVDPKSSMMGAGASEIAAEGRGGRWTWMRCTMRGMRLHRSKGTCSSIYTRRRGGAGFSMLSEYRATSPRGTAYAVRWFVWDGRDGRIVWYVRKFRRSEIGYV